MDEGDELGLLRALLCASDYGVLLSDATRRDLICNRRFREWFGLSEAEALQGAPEQVRAHVLPRIKDPEAFVQTLDAAYADPRLVSEDELELIAPRYRVLHRYTAPVEGQDGRVIGRLWTFADITARRRLERKVLAQQTLLKNQARQLAQALRAAHGRLDQAQGALDQAQQRLRESEKLSAAGALAASVAHDIRNILTPMTIELALADSDQAQDRQVALHAMRTQIDRLGLLIQRLLAVARPAQDNRQPVDLAVLLTQMSALLAPYALSEAIALETRCASKLPRPMADPVQLEQVLINLALNAIHAMHEVGGGTLRFTAGRSRGGILLRVSDTGLGMTREVRRRVFDPFFTTRPDGAGLGLFSCRRIIEAHDGRISIASAAGRGTEVRVWLPMAGEDSAPG